MKTIKSGGGYETNQTLLVDDDYLVLQDLKKIVDWNKLGFQIADTATNGKKALEITRKEQPDLIVSDISMPVMDGFDFIETIKKEMPGVYIIFISSYASFDYARRAMQNHIHSYILKNEMTSQTLTRELLQARNHILQNEVLQKEEAETGLKKFFLSENEEVNLSEEFRHRKFIFFFLARHMPLEKLKPHFQHITEAGKKAFHKLLTYLRFFISFPAEEKWDLSAYLEKAFTGIRQSFPYECLKKSLGHSELFVLELKNYVSSLFEASDADGLFMLYHNLILQLEELSGHMIPIEAKNMFSSQNDFIAFFEKIYKETELYLNRKGNAGYAPWLTCAISYIKSHYADSSLTVEQIAETAGLSTSRFSVLFRQETGQTVNDYLTEIRISQAVFLLENSNCKIYEIAEKVGYKSSQYFSQIFSQKTGYKPLHFRKKKP